VFRVLFDLFVCRVVAFSPWCLLSFASRRFDAGSYKRPRLASDADVGALSPTPFHIHKEKGELASDQLVCARCVSCVGVVYYPGDDSSVG
jgi:hypothetical protein